DGAIIADAYDWMVRDSYLSKGEKALKKATKKLLKMIAMETNHEDHLSLCSKHENKIKEDPDNDEAYEHFWNFVKYCMSDSYVTDIFVEKTIIDMNFALSLLIPYTVWKSSRFPRGKQCMLKLQELMLGWAVVGYPIRGFEKEYINPMKE